MAKITRKTAVQFAITGASTDVEQFASFEVNGSPNYTTSPATIQALPAWVTGWSATQFDGIFAPYFQDRNAVDLVTFYQIAYLLQEGIPEYDAGTTYFTNSIVQQSGQVFISLQNNNIGHTPPSGSSNAFWRLALNPANPSLYPTKTVLTSGGGSYSPPAGCVRIFVRAVGGGGGGGAGNNTTGIYTNGGNGQPSYLFNGFEYLVYAAGGQGGQNVGKVCSVGGAASGGDVNITGGAGQGYVDTCAYQGGISKFGGGGSAILASPGGSGVPNTGGGGAGFFAEGSPSGLAYGCGGAAGGYCEKMTVASSWSYSIGAGGAGATDAGGGKSGAGGSGIIIIDEFYY